MSCRYENAIGIDDGAFAFLTLDADLLALVQAFDQQGRELLTLSVENEGVVVDADGGRFYLAVIFPLVGACDDVGTGPVRVRGDAANGDGASLLLQFSGLAGECWVRLPALSCLLLFLLRLL